VLHPRYAAFEGASLRRMQIILFHTLTFTQARSKVVKSNAAVAAAAAQI
jgi:hypothetical protein